MAMDAGCPGEAWLRVVWETSPDALAVSDPEGGVLAANPAYFALYGYTPDEVIGRSFAVIFPEADRTTAEAQYREVFRGEARPPSFRSVVRRRDGAERIVEARASFVLEGSRRVAMLSTIRDITEEVTARSAAEAAGQQRRDLLASLAHDVKSPLAVIKGHAQMLRRRVARATDAVPAERLLAGLSQIEASSLQLAGLLDDLVEVSGHGGGDPPALHLVQTDLVALAREAVERHQRLADEHHVVLEAAADTAPGVWDAARLGRVLDNLLGNAIKYSPGGGPIAVRVAPGGPPRGTADDPHAHAVPGPERAGRGCVRGVLLAVEDRGIGISPVDLPHVFERFRRGGNVGASIGGSGIGLSSVQQIVEQHGGAVRVTSREGIGTTVTVWLPVQAPASPVEGSA